MRKRMMEAEESGRRVYEYEGQRWKSVLPTSEKQWEELEKRELKDQAKTFNGCGRPVRIGNHDCNRLAREEPIVERLAHQKVVE
jgi:hypothetical protein